MKVDLDVAVAVLSEHHVKISQWTSSQATLARPGGGFRRYKIVPVGRVGNVSDVASILEGARSRILLITEVETAALREVSRSLDVAFIATRTRSCRVEGRSWPVLSKLAKTPNYLLYALVRLVLSTTQTFVQVPGRERASGARSLADELSLPQSRISTMMSDLPKHSMERTSTGWVVADFNALWNWHTKNYPGPGGIRSSWCSDLPRDRQEYHLRKASIRALTEPERRDAACVPLTSGLAALPASVTEPAHGPIVKYSKNYTSLMPHGQYTPCAAADATIQLVTPEDPTLRWTASVWGDQTRTDPLITAWELLHQPHNLEAFKNFRETSQTIAQANWGTPEPFERPASGR